MSWSIPLKNFFFLFFNKVKYYFNIIIKLQYYLPFLIIMFNINL